MCINSLTGIYSFYLLEFLNVPETTFEKISSGKVISNHTSPQMLEKPGTTQTNKQKNPKIWNYPKNWFLKK